MTWAEEVGAVLGEYDEGFGPLTVDVPAESWVAALTRARDELGCTYFDWMSAVDELAEGFSVLCHLARLGPADSSAVGHRESPEAAQTNRGGGVQHLLIRTRVGREHPSLPSATGVFAGAGWHERETAEMFGIAFTDGPAADPEASHLLLPEEFEGHPLRKEFVLASRVAKPWPGAKEPGESDEGAAASPSRRKTRPPGVPDPEQWGPREPGSDAPDPLAHAAPGPARPRRASRTQRADPKPEPEEEPGDG